MLNLHTEVDRKLVCGLLIPLCMVSLVVAIVTFGIATLEFKCAIWVESVRYPPALTEFYRCVYGWGWCLPVGIIAWSVLLARSPSCRLSSVVLLAGVGLLSVVVWIILTVLAFYLVNQSFMYGSFPGVGLQDGWHGI